jgi:hypothetical protein
MRIDNGWLAEAPKPSRQSGTRKPGRFLTGVFQLQDDARARAKSQTRAAWLFVVRAVIAYALSHLPLPTWISLTFYWVAIGLGAAAWYNFNLAAGSRMAANLWPDVYPTEEVRSRTP